MEHKGKCFAVCLADLILYKEMGTGLETEVTKVFGKLSLKKEQNIC